MCPQCPCQGHLVTWKLDPLVMCGHLILCSIRHRWPFLHLESSLSSTPEHYTLLVSYLSALFSQFLPKQLHLHSPSGTRVPWDSVQRPFSSLHVGSGPSHPLTVSVAVCTQTTLKSLFQLWILSRTSDLHIEISTRSLRYPVDILSSTSPQIQLLFSITKMYSSAGVLYLSKWSAIYPAAKGKTWVSWPLSFFLILHIQITTIYCVTTS